MLPSDIRKDADPELAYGPTVVSSEANPNATRPTVSAMERPGGESTKAALVEGGVPRGRGEIITPAPDDKGVSEYDHWGGRGGRVT
jgi:hypothetical protein